MRNFQLVILVVSEKAPSSRMHADRKIIVKWQIYLETTHMASVPMLFYSFFYNFDSILGDLPPPPNKKL